MINSAAVICVCLVTATLGVTAETVAETDTGTACNAGNSMVPLFCREGVCLPRLFILGAAKSSTTSLWSLMRWQFGSVCSPVALEGDPKWFRYCRRIFAQFSSKYLCNIAMCVRFAGRKAHSLI